MRGLSASGKDKRGADVIRWQDIMKEDTALVCQSLAVEVFGAMPCTFLRGTHMTRRADHDHANEEYSEEESAVLLYWSGVNHGR